VFGHAIAEVGALSKSMNSNGVDLHSSAAIVRLQSDIEKPGPFNDDSKTPEYTFTGFIDQVEFSWIRISSVSAPISSSAIPP